MTDWETAVAQARDWVDLPLPEIVLRAKAEEMREALILARKSHGTVPYRAAAVEQELEGRAAEYERAARGGGKT